MLHSGQLRRSAQAEISDVKGHVVSAHPPLSGFHIVYFAVRHGQTLQLQLAASKTEDFARLKAAEASGECLELFYEPHDDILPDGEIITIC